jgi:hypothetical protein
MDGRGGYLGLEHGVQSRQMPVAIAGAELLPGSTNPVAHQRSTIVPSHQV